MTVPGPCPPLKLRQQKKKMQILDEVCLTTEVSCTQIISVLSQIFTPKIIALIPSLVNMGPNRVQLFWLLSSTGACIIHFYYTKSKIVKKTFTRLSYIIYKTRPTCTAVLYTRMLSDLQTETVFPLSKPQSALYTPKTY